MSDGGKESFPDNPSEDSILKKNNRYKREIRRLRNTASFQLGLHLTTAVRRPWRLLLLPISFPLFALNVGFQKLGRKPNKSSAKIDLIDDGESNNSIVLFPTNGVGFGHFTRMYAVARALRKADPTLEIIFFTPMPTLHILYNEQFPTYHLAGRYKHADMTATQWNGLVEDMLHMIFETHRPRWFMFDGAFPYRGMLNAIASRPQMEKWWMRRGSLKSNKTIPVDSLSFFDGVIVPSEGKEIHAQPDVNIVPPIMAVEPIEAWNRTFARSRLSVPENGKVVYVQLGAGRINKIQHILEIVLEELYAHPNVFVVLGESMLGERLPFIHERLRVIRDYPNALYAHGFDASIQAGGYNSYHEMRRFGIPTLFIPNTETGMDDQVTRCKEAESDGWGLVFLPNEHDLNHKIRKLLDMNADPIPSVNGVDSIMDLLGIAST